MGFDFERATGRPDRRPQWFAAPALLRAPVVSLSMVALGAAALMVLRLVVYAALAPDGLAAGLCQWDCNWYLSITTQGYDAAPHLVTGQMQANWAFFPLFPLLLRLAGGLGGISPMLSGVVAASLAMWAFAVLGWVYRARTRRDARPWLWLALLLAWPYGFYFNAPYSESLYAALSTGFLLALSARRPWLAACCSALLTATRPTGILLAMWLGVDRLRRVRVGRPGVMARGLLPALLAPLGLVAFMGFLWWRVGDPLAFSRIQAAWDHSLRNPLAVLLEALRGSGNGHFGVTYEAVWALVGLAVAGWMLVRRRGAEAWFCGATVLMGLLAGGVGSMPRFVSCNPAFLFAVTDMLEAIPSRAVRVLLLVVGVGVQVFFLRAWYRGAYFLI